MVLALLCSCGWIRTAENSDHQGKMLGILRGVHDMTFKDHTCKIEEE